MHTLFVSGNDTNIGKTQVVSAIAGELSDAQRSVQIVKPVETGVSDSQSGDAIFAAEQAGADTDNTHTLLTYPDPIAPVEAAAKQEVELSLDLIISAYVELRPKEFRIVEGAGGLAVPLDRADADWCDFIRRIPDPVSVLLVVENRLGAIHQARTLMHYARDKGLNPHLILNETSSQNEDVLSSNSNALCKEEMSYAGSLAYGASRIRWHNGGLETLFKDE